MCAGMLALHLMFRCRYATFFPSLVTLCYILRFSWQWRSEEWFHGLWQCAAWSVGHLRIGNWGTIFLHYIGTNLPEYSVLMLYISYCKREKLGPDTYKILSIPHCCQMQLIEEDWHCLFLVSGQHPWTWT